MSSNYDYDSLPVIQIRHRIDISKEGLTRLFDKDRVALHWRDLHSRDPNHYYEAISDEDRAESAHDDIEALNEIDRNGALVLADYSTDWDGRKGIHKNKLFLGVVPEGTFEYKEYQKASGGTGVYNTVRFDSDTITEISITERPDIFSDKPARGALSPCRKTENRLRTIVDPNKSVSKTGPEHWSHDQFEHLCEQYLSLIQYPGEFFTVTPTGGQHGQQRLIDINGGVKKKPVVAQVTTKSDKREVKSKFDDLDNASFSDVDVYFFGPQQFTHLDKESSNVTYIGEQDVYNKLNENSMTKPMLDRVLNR